MIRIFYLGYKMNFHQHSNLKLDTLFLHQRLKLTTFKPLSKPYSFLHISSSKLTATRWNFFKLLQHHQTCEYAVIFIELARLKRTICCFIHLFKGDFYETMILALALIRFFNVILALARLNFFHKKQNWRT